MLIAFLPSRLPFLIASPHPPRSQFRSSQSTEDLVNPSHRRYARELTLSSSSTFPKNRSLANEPPDLLPSPLPFLPQATTATKLIFLPIIGVSFVQGLSATTSLYPKEDKILSFVAMLLSGSPAAVNQLVVTNLVAPEGKTDTIAAFLLFQYVFMFFSSTALTAVSLLFVS